MDRYPFFKSLLEQDNSAVVLCNLEHKVIYMNPAACRRYARYGGEKLLGRNLMECHNAKSGELIRRVVDWFQERASNNRVHTFYNEQENKDVYMIALRDEEENLIGYYEKHEYRNRDMTPLYDLTE